MKVKDILGVLFVTFLIVTGLAVCCDEDDDRVFMGWLILPCPRRWNYFEWYGDGYSFKWYSFSL